MLSLADGPEPAILRSVATAGTGVPELLDLILTAPVATRAHAAPRISIDHLGIAVNSIDQAAAFYRAIGLEVEHRETVAKEKVHVAMLPAGDSRIELLEPSEPDSSVAKYLEKRGPGLHHVALKVPDLNAAVERLRAAGSRLLNEPRQGAGGHLYVFVHPASTGGVLLELIQES
jgi:methylmalonyl-CoA epimerase